MASRCRSDGGTKKAINIQVYVDGEPKLVHTAYDGLSGDSIAANAVYNLGAERTPGAPAFRGCVDNLQFFNGELPAEQLGVLWLDPQRRATNGKAPTSSERWPINAINCGLSTSPCIVACRPRW